MADDRPYISGVCDRCNELRRLYSRDIWRRLILVCHDCELLFDAEAQVTWNTTLLTSPRKARGSK